MRIGQKISLRHTHFEFVIFSAIKNISDLNATLSHYSAT